MTGLAPGTYYVVYTFTYPSGAETFASPPSADVHGHGGPDSPASRCRRCPPAPRGSTSISPTRTADPGSATRYYTGVTTTTVQPASSPCAPERGHAAVVRPDADHPQGQRDRAATPMAATCCRARIISIHVHRPWRSRVDAPALPRQHSLWRRQHSPGFAADAAARRDGLQHLSVRPGGEPGLGDVVCVRGHDDDL